MPNTVGEDILRRLNILTIATIGLYLITIALVVYLFFAAARDRTTIRKTNSALCTLRKDLQSRVAVSEQFLKDNPHGSSGITPAVLHNSIKAQRSTIESLSILRCPPDL
jgi:hypothetical protein